MFEIDLKIAKGVIQKSTHYFNIFNKEKYKLVNLQQLNNS
jgi:hypothetical protein